MDGGAGGRHGESDDVGPVGAGELQDAGHDLCIHSSEGQPAEHVDAVVRIEARKFWRAADTSMSSASIARSARFRRMPDRALWPAPTSNSPERGQQAAQAGRRDAVAHGPVERRLLDRHAIQRALQSLIAPERLDAATLCAGAPTGRQARARDPGRPLTRRSAPSRSRRAPGSRPRNAAPSTGRAPRSPSPMAIRIARRPPPRCPAPVCPAPPSTRPLAWTKGRTWRPAYSASTPARTCCTESRRLASGPAVPCVFRCTIPRSPTAETRRPSPRTRPRRQPAVPSNSR